MNLFGNISENNKSMNFSAPINYNKIITFPERDTSFAYENADVVNCIPIYREFYGDKLLSNSHGYKIVLFSLLFLRGK